MTQLIQYMDHSDNIDISGPVAALESIRPHAGNHLDSRSPAPAPPSDNDADPVSETLPDTGTGQSDPHQSDPHQSDTDQPDPGLDDTPVVVTARNGTPLVRKPGSRPVSPVAVCLCPGNRRHSNRVRAR